MKREDKRSTNQRVRRLNELNMTEKEYSMTQLKDAAGDRVDKHLNDAMMVDGRDDGLDGWFKPAANGWGGFRIVEPNTIARCHGYTMGSKEELYNDHTYIALPQEKKKLIPEKDTLFLLLGTLKTGETVYTHWLVESARFAQKVACEWWDSSEGEVLQEWGIEYEDVKEN